MQRTVALYARTNTDLGDARMEETYRRLERQMAELRALASDFGRIVIAEYVDVSSGVTYDRPGLNAILEDVRLGKTDTVLLWNETRLGRNMVQNSLIVKEINEYGGRIYFASHFATAAIHDFCRKVALSDNAPQ